MALSKAEWLALEKKAHELRNLCLDTTFWAGSGHIGGGMSVMDMLTILYHKYLNIKKDDPNWEDRDRFILSKGHSGIAYAPVLCDFGYNDPEQLKTFNLTNSKMGIHLDSNKVVGVDASTGSLGQGLSIALGTALAAKVLGKDYKTYCILGDGECDEGSNWEAAMAIAAFKATNVITFVDRNKCMIDGRTEDVMPLEPFADKWRAFGFHVIEVDGQNLNELSEAIDSVDGAHALITSADYPNTIMDSLVVNTKFAKENPEVVDAVTEAWYKAVDFLKENPEKAYELMASGFEEVSAEDIAADCEGLDIYGRAENEALKTGADGKSIKDISQDMADFWMDRGECETNELDAFFSRIK